MLVNRYEYPSLDLLMWDMHTDVIDGALALKIYETKWRYLNPHEVKGEVNRPEYFGDSLS